MKAVKSYAAMSELVRSLINRGSRAKIASDGSIHIGQFVFRKRRP